MTEDVDISLGSDVQIIREILFGEQLQNIQEHIHDLEKVISDLQRKNQQLRKELESATKQIEHGTQTREENLEKASNQIQNQLSLLEDEFNKAIEQRDRNSKKMLKDLDHKFDERLTQQIAEHQTFHDNLITSLVATLLKFRQEPDDENGSN